MLPSLFEEIVVPFSFHDPYQTWQARGLAKASEKGLSLEFEIEEFQPPSGLFKTGVQEMTVPLDQLEEVLFKSGALWSHLLIKTRNLKALDELPGTHPGKTKLGIARGDREAAQRLVSTLNDVSIGKSAQSRRGSIKCCFPNLDSPFAP